MTDDKHKRMLVPVPSGFLDTGSLARCNSIVALPGPKGIHCPKCDPLTYAYLGATHRKRFSNELFQKDFPDV